jgi:hypothetical protein
MDHMERKNQFALQDSLMSPPEPTPHDSFTHHPSSPERPGGSHMKPLFANSAASFPISPPVSPASKTITAEEAAPLVVRDPILYPNPEVQSASPSQAPLFTDDETLAAQRVVDGHVAARESSLFREASPPRQSEYELALEFKSQVAKAYSVNRRQWYNRERSYLLEDRALHAGARRYPTIAPANIRSHHAGGGSARKQPAARPSKVVRPPKPSRATPDPTRRVVREDKDYLSLPDYCPPLSSLPSKPNSLKVDWRGAPIDLRLDPNAHLLHPDELLLAANLRLDCATYLTSKRRIFIKRIEALRIGKAFRKTDAQQACKIDVNKASKLWQAFEKVGWLNPKWVEKYV